MDCGGGVDLIALKRNLPLRTGTDSRSVSGFLRSQYDDGVPDGMRWPAAKFRSQDAGAHQLQAVRRWLLLR